jgi:hypothetical protein
MDKLSQLMEAASSEPPAPDFDLDALIAKANRQRRVRVAGTAVLSAAVLVAGSVGVSVLADEKPAVTVRPAATPSATPPAPDDNTNIIASLPGGRQLTEPAGKAAARLRADVVASLLKYAPKATFEWTEVRQGRHDAAFTFYPSQGGYKSAGLIRDSFGLSYLFVDVMPRAAEGPHAYSCLPPSGPKPATCRAYVGSDGSVVTEATYPNPGGKIQYVISVDRPDGTEVSMMATNDMPGLNRSEPTLSTTQLAVLGAGLTLYPAAYPGGKPLPTPPPEPMNPPAGGGPKG